MFSHLTALEELKRRGAMYWLPHGGRDNGVWADTWVILAELEAGDVATVLELLSDADVGGYVALPGGQKARANGRHLLYVDMMQYHRAVDVVMVFLRERAPRAEATRTAARGTSAREPISASRWRVIAAAIRQLGVKDAVRRVIWVLIAAALIGLGSAVAYAYGSTRFPVVHHHRIDTHQTPNS